MSDPIQEYEQRLREGILQKLVKLIAAKKMKKHLNLMNTFIEKIK